MAYTWCTTAQIQKYLDTESSIVIGATGFAEADAQELENHAVDDIENFLEPGWNVPLPTGVASLIRLASKLTAAYIGASRMGAGLGQATAEWTERYKNEVYARLRRMIINQPSITIAGATKKTMTLQQRLLASKSRERSVLNDV